MPTIDVTEEQILTLLDQLTSEQRNRVLNLFATASNGSGANGTTPAETTPPRPRFGSGKNAIAFIADDFDAPLEDMKEYME